jgi:hypothetical protein
MSTLEDVVRSVVEDFIQRGELFTALDVSNKVKETLPFERHRSIRDVVRALFVNEIEPKGWARSPITVMLSDGTQQEALLYHALSDSWDLDNKYDQQKRSQVAVNKTAVAVAAVATTSSPLSNVNTTCGIAPMPGAATITVSATTPVPMPTARDLWKQLFDTQPSLFPTK